VPPHSREDSSRPRTRSAEVPLSCTVVRPRTVGNTAAHDPFVTGTHSPLDIEYSPCPVSTSKSLAALRRRMTDILVQSCHSVGTLHPPAQWSRSNPIYFAVAQGRSLPYPTSLNAERNSDLNTHGLVKSPDGVPLKLRKKDPSLCFTENMNGTQKGKTNGHVNLEDENDPKKSRLPLSPLSQNMASLRLSSGPTDASLMQPAPRITPPSPFLNSTTFISTNRNQGNQVPNHDVTDPRFLSVYSMLHSADVAFNISEPETAKSAELSRNRSSPHTPTTPGPVNRVLCYPEESPVKKTDASREVDRQEAKRPSLRRVRNVTSNSEEGPPVKLQPLISCSGQVTALEHKIKHSSEERDASYSCRSPVVTTTRRGTVVNRTRRSLKQSSKFIRGKDKVGAVKDVGDGVFAVDKVVGYSTCSDEASPRSDLHPEEESMLRRQGGFRRRQRKIFRNSATSDSFLLNIPDRIRGNLPGLTLPNGIPSPLSPEDSNSWWPRNHVNVSKCYDMSCHLVDLAKANSPQTSSHQNMLGPTSSIIESLSCLDLSRQFGLSSFEGIPSPLSPTPCDDDQYCSSVGIAGIQPLSTSSAPPPDSSSVMRCRQKKGTAEENCSPTSNDTWNSHDHRLLKVPHVTDRHLLKDATPERGNRHMDDEGLDSYSGKGALKLFGALD
jgi:hypothetical protein